MDFLIHWRPFLTYIRLLYIDFEGNMGHIFVWREEHGENS